ncbi:hypothetical protein N8385_07330, partial [Cyclobacteriaceae bacterium]|nr:hypothetical protein [Cyclobacteriaceae bacterium]
KMIRKLSQEQKELSKESGKKDLPLEDLKKQQSEITQKFGEFKRDLDNLESLKHCVDTNPIYVNATSCLNWAYV